jgi:FKBP-type peptidyl-prolyl cis-trans isomerase FkpA
MAATKAQRIGIWIIAVFMAVGTIGSFVAIVFANENQATDQKQINDLTEKYTKETEAYQAKVDVQSKELSDKYFATFSQYQSRAGSFNKDDVSELKKEDLVVGDGAALTKDSTFTAYYIGWNPSGKVFDSSIDGEALKQPITAGPGSVIQGWTDGVDGMKIGGIREVSIPSDLAYGETGQGEDIPANTPLKFVIFVIPTPEKIPEPEIPQQLLDYYQTGRLQ